MINNYEKYEYNDINSYEGYKEYLAEKEEILNQAVEIGKKLLNLTKISEFRIFVANLKEMKKTEPNELEYIKNHFHHQDLVDREEKIIEKLNQVDDELMDVYYSSGICIYELPENIFNIDYLMGKKCRDKNNNEPYKFSPKEIEAQLKVYDNL